MTDRFPSLTAADQQRAHDAALTLLREFEGYAAQGVDLSQGAIGASCRTILRALATIDALRARVAELEGRGK